MTKSILLILTVFTVLLLFSGVSSAVEITDLNTIRNDLTGEYTIADGTVIEINSATWVPIGTNGEPFTGTITGGENTKIIINGDNNALMFELPYYTAGAGLFGASKGAAEFKNLNIIVKANLTSNFAVPDGNVYDVGVGVLVGRALAGEFENCRVTFEGPYSIFGNSYVGGMIGLLYDGSVSQCSVENGLVDARSSVDGTNVGGLIGAINTDDVKTIVEIDESYFTGKVYGNTSVGGLIGIVYNANIDECYSEGFVQADNKYAGGLIGYIHDSDVSDCYSTSDVSVLGLYKNDLVKKDKYGQDGQMAGGLVGVVKETTFSNCYTAGLSVSATGDYAGGLIGLAFDVDDEPCITITDCYSLVRSVSSPVSGKVIGGIQLDLVDPKLDVNTAVDYIYTYSGMKGDFTNSNENILEITNGGSVTRAETYKTFPAGVWANFKSTGSNNWTKSVTSYGLPVFNWQGVESEVNPMYESSNGGSSTGKAVVVDNNVPVTQTPPETTPVTDSNPESTPETAFTAPVQDEPKPAETQSKTGLYIALIIGAVIVIGAVVYIVKFKNN